MHNFGGFVRQRTIANRSFHLLARRKQFRYEEFTLRATCLNAAQLVNALTVYSAVVEQHQQVLVVFCC